MSCHDKVRQCVSCVAIVKMDIIMCGCGGCSVGSNVHSSHEHFSFYYHAALSLPRAGASHIYHDTPGYQPRSSMTMMTMCGGVLASARRPLSNTATIHQGEGGLISVHAQHPPHDSLSISGRIYIYDFTFLPLRHLHVRSQLEFHIFDTNTFKKASI